MTLIRGKDMLLSMDDGQGGFDAVGGLRTRTFSLSAGTVDITHADSPGWRELLADTGIRQANISGNGLFVDEAAAERVRTVFFGGSHVAWQLAMPGYGTFEGPFQITNLDFAGDFRGEATFSLSLASAGEITFAGDVT